MSDLRHLQPWPGAVSSLVREGWGEGRGGWGAGWASDPTPYTYHPL